jgi:hypothetical protein
MTALRIATMHPPMMTQVTTDDVVVYASRELSLI